jgi:hypothetical protein
VQQVLHAWGAVEQVLLPAWLAVRRGSGNPARFQQVGSKTSIESVA